MANFGETFANSFSSAYQMAKEIAYRKMKDTEDKKSEKSKLAFDAYLKTLPSTYTVQDPATGKPTTYTIQSDVPEDIRSAAETEFKNYLGVGSSQPQPQPMRPMAIGGLQVGNPNGTIPPNIAVVQQGGKTTFKGTGKTDSPVSEAEKTLSGTGMFLKQFGRSYNELKNKFPEIGDIGYTGWMTRKGAGVENYFDNLPETKAFEVEKKPLANQMARDIEGGRVTDQDRQIYADSFADTLTHPTATNIRLSANSLIKLHKKGGDISGVLGELSSSGIDIMDSIVAEVLKDVPELKQKVLMKAYQSNPDRFEVVNE